MPGLSPTEWVDLIMLAKVSNIGFEELLSTIRPILFNIARNISPQRAEDLLQAGIVKIWRSLDKIDLKRPHTIRRVILDTGIYGMKDELRSILRRNRGEVAKLDESIAVVVLAKAEQTKFAGLLADYRDYISTTGSFIGAHQHMSKLKGTGMRLTRKRFHQAVEAFLKGENR